MYATNRKTREIQNGGPRHAKGERILCGEAWLKVESDYRRYDHNWWVALSFSDGGASIVLSTAHENMKPGAASLYFTSSDVAAAHKELSAKGAKVEELKDDLYGPGSGVKWFNLEDPDGNQVFLVQA